MSWENEKILRNGNFRARKLHSKNYKQEQNIILKWLENKIYNKEKILEIGCGEFPLFELSTKIDIAEVRPDIIKIDCNLPFASKLDKQFNIIIVQYVICHLWNIEDFFIECYKLLHNNGILIISLPNDNYWRKRLNFRKKTDEQLWFLDNKTYWRLNPKTLKILAEKYKFVIDDIRPIGKSRLLCISPSMIAKLRK